ncbi:MAG TPA: hypothetical protein VNU72_02230, partial [Puia sp.]|nr:hypothetical protein [Puia sp.]
GVYGNFIAASLRNFDRVDFFIDQNPLLDGKTMVGKPVILPKEIPSGVQLVYVGINPITARAAMESIDWRGEAPNFFYL